MFTLRTFSLFFVLFPSRKYENILFFFSQKSTSSTKCKHRVLLMKIANCLPCMMKVNANKLNRSKHVTKCEIGRNQRFVCVR